MLTLHLFLDSVKSKYNFFLIRNPLRTLQNVECYFYYFVEWIKSFCSKSGPILHWNSLFKKQNNRLAHPPHTNVNLQYQLAAWTNSLPLQVNGNVYKAIKMLTLIPAVHYNFWKTISGLRLYRVTSYWSISHFQDPKFTQNPPSTHTHQPVVLVSERILQGQFVGMRMGLGIRSFRKQRWKEKKGKQKSVSRISLFSCLTDPNKSQTRQEASSRATEGSSRYYALIHHCQLNLLCPAAAINLLLPISIPEPRHGTEIKLQVDWLHESVGGPEPGSQESVGLPVRPLCTDFPISSYIDKRDN